MRKPNVEGGWTLAPKVSHNDTNERKFDEVNREARSEGSAGFSGSFGGRGVLDGKP